MLKSSLISSTVLLAFPASLAQHTGSMAIAFSDVGLQPQTNDIIESLLVKLNMTASLINQFTTRDFHGPQLQIWVSSPQSASRSRLLHLEGMGSSLLCKLWSND